MANRGPYGAPVGGGEGGNGGNWNGGALGWFLRAMFGGSRPPAWIGLILFGIFLGFMYKNAVEFKKEVLDDSAATRRSLSEYVAANENWQKTSQITRDKLVRQVDNRFRRVYSRNGWDYEELVP